MALIFYVSFVLFQKKSCRFFEAINFKTDLYYFNDLFWKFLEKFYHFWCFMSITGQFVFLRKKDHRCITFTDVLPVDSDKLIIKIEKNQNPIFCEIK